MKQVQEQQQQRQQDHQQSNHDGGDGDKQGDEAGEGMDGHREEGKGLYDSANGTYVVVCFRHSLSECVTSM
jgi:hypothetical protein